MTPELRAVLLAFGPAIGIGIARFAYSLVLPDMRQDLDWSYADAGWMNTINAIGYIVGALTAAPIAKRTGLHLMFVGAAGTTVVAVLLVGLTRDFVLLSVLRLAAGITAGLIFVAGGALTAALVASSPARGGVVLGLFYTGPGIGITLSGALVPGLLVATGPGGWDVAWLALGGLAAALWLVSTVALRHTPRAQGRGKGEGAPFSVAATLPLLVGYVLFGIGSISYMTFMFAYLAALDTSAFELSAFWVCIGLAAIAAPWAWGWVIATLHHGYAAMAAMALTLVGAALPLLVDGYAWALVSALVFGSAFFAVVTATTAFARRNAGVGAWPFAIAVFTFAFGLGQSIGPIMSGAISDATGGLSDGLAWGCGAILAGVVLTAFQRDRTQQE